MKEVTDNYFDSLNSEIRNYFKILSEDFPSWLNDYINTTEMQRIKYVSMHCGTDYTNLFNIKYWYSNLDHSVGVALILWHFTHNKKIALSGLFHDIATPVFKHCIDFMNGDSELQESTEEKTEEIIKSSREIMALLKRDGIKIDEVSNYKMYSLADNDLPRLSADRFEYNFSSGLSFYRVWDLKRIKKVYDNIVIVTNEDGNDELAFQNKEICEEYIRTVSKLWPMWISDKDRFTMQFLADICKNLYDRGKLLIDDLYTLKEKEVIDIILSDEELSSAFTIFQKVNKTYQSKTFIKDKYCTNIKSKKRYLVPLVKCNNQVVRITKISKEVDRIIKEFKSLKMDGYYVYSDVPSI